MSASPDRVNVLWFLPTHGDGRYLGTAAGARATDLRYLRQIAEAADQLGYFGVLLPTGKSCEDSWIVASAMVATTERLRFLVAVRPGLQPPTVAARMTATLDRLSVGRLLINVVTGGDPVENKGDGIFLNHAERYEVTREFLPIYKALLSGETVNTGGRHIRIEGGQLLFPPVQAPHPPLYFGGSSEEAIDVAAETIDKYLTWGEPPALVGEKIAKVRAAARKRERDVSFGIRLHVIVRETSEEAWAAADRLIALVDDQTIAKAQAIFARMDSVGQSRMTALHGGRRDRLVVSPNLWAGVGLVRGGAGTALVGSPEEVAARMEEYRAVGVDSFILSGYPHLEEAYRFAELVFPLLPLAHAPKPVSLGVNTGPFGETIANENPTGGVVTAAVRTRVRAAGRTALRTLAPWALPVCLVVIWEIASRNGLLSSRLLPAPSAVFVAFWDSLWNGTLIKHAAISAERALKGLLIGGGIGFSRPGVLLLDEPFGALDALTRSEVHRLLERIWSEHGFTTLLITHDVAEAVALADRVIVLRAGSIALDLAIDLPRPRRGAGDGSTVNLQARILDEV